MEVHLSPQDCIPHGTVVTYKFKNSAPSSVAGLVPGAQDARRRPAFHVDGVPFIKAIRNPFATRGTMVDLDAELSSSSPPVPLVPSSGAAASSSSGQGSVLPRARDVLGASKTFSSAGPPGKKTTTLTITTSSSRLAQCKVGDTVCLSRRSESDSQQEESSEVRSVVDAGRRVIAFML